MLSRLRCGRRCATTKVSSSSEVGRSARGADHGALLVRGLPGQAVWPGRVVQAVVRAALAHGLGAHPVVPGQHAAGLIRAGDFGPGDRCGAGVRVDLRHGSPPSCRRDGQALEAIDVFYDHQPYRVPCVDAPCGSRRIRGAAPRARVRSYVRPQTAPGGRPRAPMSFAARVGINNARSVAHWDRRPPSRPARRSLAAIATSAPRPRRARRPAGSGPAAQTATADVR